MSPVASPPAPTAALHSPAAARVDARADSRGSVLIFVVGVLLLLAIVATAFLGSSRSDRTATQQNSFNTQVDLLLEGIVNAAKSRILSDESNPARMSLTATSTETYDAITTNDMATGLMSDDWLASRTPATADANTPFNPTSGALSQNSAASSQAILNSLLTSPRTGRENPALWPAISEAVLGGGTFESPYRPGVPNSPTPYTGSLEYVARKRMLPTFIRFNGQDWPAFTIDTSEAPQPGNTNAATRFQSFLAGDADNDGIADSGLFKIPVGQLSGVTYYGAVRIIDNNAAINLNTAQSRDYDFAGNGGGGLMATTGVSGAFTSSVGLAELLRTYSAAPAAGTEYDTMYNAAAGVNEFSGLNQLRLNAATATVRPNGVQQNTVDPSPYDDTTLATATPSFSSRPDFEFISTGDMLSSQLGRRTSNPGRAFAATASTYRSVFVDGLALASRFSLAGTTELDSVTPADSENALARKMYLSLNCVPYPLTPGAATYPPAPPAAIPTTHLARSTPFSPQADGSPSVGVDAWFRQNFNYLVEDPANAATFMNRRTILTGFNGVGDQTADVVTETPASEVSYLFNPLANQWTGVASTGTATDPVPIVNRQPNVAVYFPFTPAGGGSVRPTLPMTIPSASSATSVGKVLIEPKVSINTARFEELFYGYFKTMARQGFTGRADDIGTPFSKLYNGNIYPPVAASGPGVATNAIAARNDANFGFDPTSPKEYYSDGATLDQYYKDPFIGSRFLPGTAVGGFTARPELGQPSVINGQTNTTEQHPLRMFRSSLRPTYTRTAANTPPAAAVWNENTPRLPADQMVILRSAIAAANLEALRDSSHSGTAALNGSDGNDRLVEHRIPLTARIGNVPVPVVARVYGLKRQPYICEVYANTNNQDDYDNTFVPPPIQAADPNPRGYVAIKLYNPYPVDISLENCRLVGMRRVIDAAVITAPGTNAAQYPNMEVLPAILSPTALPTGTGAGVDTVDQIQLSRATSNVLGGTLPGYVIPANGTLVLENVDGSAVGAPGTRTAAPKDDDATHRPSSTGITPTIGMITVPPPVPPATVPTENYAYVPGLQRVVWDRELVLMRPTNATPPTAAGPSANTLTYTFANGTAPAGLSALAPNQSFVPLDSFDFTGLNVPDGTVPARVRAEAWHYLRSVDFARPWRYVYPGRYDGDQSIPKSAGEIPRPRQQGVYQAYEGGGVIVGWDPLGPDKDPWARIPLPAAAAVALSKPASTPTNGSATIATYPDTFTTQLNVVNWPGDNRLQATIRNRWPFGGFRRLGDMLEAPFIGSYTIETEANALAGNSTFLEINAVTMDAAMAEDTDPNDNENPVGTDNGSQSREQLGRFVPLRASTATPGTRQNGTPASFAQKVLAMPTDPPSDFSTEYDTVYTTDPARYGDATADIDENSTGGAVLPIQPGGASLAVNLAADRINRYRWAASLFDHFAINSPHDDYTPNYPTQPRWQPAVAYSIGDTVQFGQNVYVCRVAHTSGLEGSGDPDAGATATDTTLFTPPASSARWAALPRTPVSNTGAAAGDRSNIYTATGAQRSFDFYDKDDTNEGTIATPGLINLNTASEAVLAKLPWVPRATAGNITDLLNFSWDDVADPYPFNLGTNGVTAGADTFDDNAQIAHLIVAYRDGNYYNQNGVGVINNVGVGGPGGLGIRTLFRQAEKPFQSLYDLYKVPGFRAAQDKILFDRNSGAGILPLDGDYSPLPAPAGPGGNDGVKYDFEEQTLFMNRVSNLVTCRSDVFTLYALVQGWRNVGTDHPELVVQRRAAFIIDRSGVTAQSPTLSSTRVPVN